MPQYRVKIKVSWIPHEVVLNLLKYIWESQDKVDNKNSG